MVTQLYTPNIRQIARLPQTAGSIKRAAEEASSKNEHAIDLSSERTRRSAADPTVNEDEGRNPSASQNEQDDSHQQRLSTLREHQQKGQISIGTILTDFQKTLESIQAPASLIESLTPYFQVIAHQASLQNPSSKLIRSHLQFAAKQVDDYIGHSLGETSSVVKEWIDALLTQPINYKGATLDTVFAKATPATTLSAEAKRDIKSAFTTGLSALKTGDYETAANQFKAVQDTLSQPSVTVPKTLAAKTAYFLGKIAKAQNDPSEAILQFENSLQLLTPPTANGSEQANNHPMTGKLNMLLASLYAKTGNLTQALSKTETAISSLASQDKPAALAQAHQFAGDLSVKQGLWDNAQAHYERAIGLIDSRQEKRLANLHHRLGLNFMAQGKSADALGYILSSYQQAQQNGEITLLKNAGETLAKVYLDLGQPDKALGVLKQITLA